jgi:AcrR family transcriptional regulator
MAFRLYMPVQAGCSEVRVATAATPTAPRAQRADAQRNADALVAAAKKVFAESGVDAPAKLITDRAGVGVGTLYRHFPLRSDLVKAVLSRDVDDCIQAAADLSADNAPDVALELWIRRFTEFVGTKRGLGPALHSGDPAFEGLPEFMLGRLNPALAGLLQAASADGSIRPGVDADDILRAVSHLSSSSDAAGNAFSQRMVALLIDGLRAAPLELSPRAE